MGQGPERAGYSGLRTAYASGSVAGLTDAQLLDRFMHRRDDGASFEALLARHGPMVLGVCRALLRDEHAADDAFQATFLVLVRRAGSVRVGDSLGRWLYGVAHKVAVQSRRQSARRNTREQSVATDPIAEPASDLEAADLRAAIHDELARLPESTRAAIVLCHLEGLTHEEAASRLGWPVGTVRSRLARGRDRLRDRLTRRGLAPASASAVPMLGLDLSPMVPERLIAATGRAAAKVIAGEALSAGLVPASVLTLTSGVLQTMFFTKLKIAALVIASTGALSLSGVYAFQATEKGKREGGAPAPASAAEQPAEKPGARTASEVLANEWQRAMDRLVWAEQMHTKGYVSKAAVLEAVSHAKALNDQVGQRLDKLQRELEGPKPTNATPLAPKAVAIPPEELHVVQPGVPTVPKEEVDPKRWKELAERRILRAADEIRNSASEPPKPPAEPVDSSADELAIQFRAALAARASREKLHRSGAISDAIWREAENLPRILGSRIESRMQELRDELERLESQLKAKQAAVSKAKAQVDLAKATTGYTKRLRAQNVVSKEEEVRADTELLVADSQLQIHTAEMQGTEILIKQAKRRLDQFAPVSKMAKEAIQTQDRQDTPLPNPQPPPPPAASSPKRPDEAADPSADELAIQFRAAVEKAERLKQLFQNASIPASVWLEAAAQPQLLGARIESRMEELRNELERLEIQLKIKQATVGKAKASVDVASAVVARQKRLDGRIHGAVSEEDKQKGEAELKVTQAELAIREIEARETEIVIKQAKRRLDQFASVSKMAKDTLQSHDGQDKPRTEPQPPPPAAEVK